MDAPLAFGGRHALDAMDAGFVFQAGEDVAAGDFGDAFLQAAEFGVAILQHLKPPALGAGVFLVHPVELGGEEAGFIPTGGRADFEDGGAFVGFVLRQQRDAEFVLQRRDAVLEVVEFGLRQFLHFRVGHHGLGFPAGLFGGAQILDAGDDGFQFGQLAGGFDVGFPAHDFRQHGAQFVGAGRDAVEALDEVHGVGAPDVPSSWWAQAHHPRLASVKSWVVGLRPP